MDLKGLIAQIKSVLELTDVMEYYGVEFVSKNSSSWMAKCFLHEEQKPSLNVSPGKGLFFCFSTGCQATGDIISFCQQFHNLDAYEAAVKLAEEFGIDTSPYLELTANDKKIRRLINLTQGLVDVCHKELLKSQGAMKYVKGRGVSSGTIEAFRLGFSPSVQFMVRSALSLKATQDEIEVLGLKSRLQFEGCILFPIYDKGTPRYFYGSCLTKTDPSTPKYVSPYGQHPLRQQGSMFGLNIARKECRREGGLILVEGFFDVLTLHSRGFTNVVSMLGSSPRSEQMEILSSLQVPKCIILFDADKAGEAGIQKAIESRKGEMALKIGFIPEGDPDEYVLKYGDEALRDVLSQSVGAVDYLMGNYIDRLVDGDLAERSQITKSLVSLSAKLPGHEAALMMKEISDKTGISIDDLKEQSVTTDDKKVYEHEGEVLAACIKDDVCLLEATAKFRGRDVWLNPKYRAIWNAIVDLKKKGVHQFTPELIKETAKDVHLNGVVTALMEKDYANFDYHASTVYDNYSRRTLRGAGKKLYVTAGDTNKAASSVLTEHLATLSKDVAPDSAIEFTAEQQVNSAMDYIHERMDADEKIPGISLGPEWSNFTQAILGFQRGYIYIISALPKVGKTNTTLNWCKSVAIDQRVPALWLNFEMRQRDLALRFLSMMSGVSNTRMKMGAIGAPDKKLIDEAAERYYQAPLYVVDAATLTLQEVVNVIRKYVYDKGVKIIFLDYIQLIRKSDGRMQYWEHHQNISTELKSVISSLDVPLVAVSQLSKAGLEGGGAAHQGGSFKYLQDADAVMELRRLSREEIQATPNSNLRLNLEFSRHGVQEVSIPLFFNQESLKCSEV